MAVENKTLIPSRTMESAQTTQYTAPSTATTTSKAIIDTFTVTNYSVSSANINMWFVPSGGSVSNDNLIIDNLEIAVDETRSLYEIVGHIIEAGGSIVTSGTATSLSIRCSGREIS